MKQTIIALLSVMGVVEYIYSCKERGVYVGNERNLWNIPRVIPINAFAFYRLAKRFGIQNPSAFALANGTNLVKGK